MSPVNGIFSFLQSRFQRHDPDQGAAVLPSAKIAGVDPGLCIEPQILSAKVHHQRSFPRDNTFNYSLYYLVLPLSCLESISQLAVNRPGLVSFQSKDHGARDGDDLREWLDTVLAEQGFTQPIKEVVLVAMPRTLGYGFNPVSFWLCLDEQRGLRAVLCEVNNTFGETHCYACFHGDGQVIQATEWLTAQKCFHVSPFMPRSGRYYFRFQYQENALNIWIHYHDVHGRRKLVTALTGQLRPLTRKSLLHALWVNPWVGVKTMMLIHWQALKLWCKKIEFFSKPEQLETRITRTETGADGSSSKRNSSWKPGCTTTEKENQNERL